MVPTLTAADPPGGGGRQSLIANPSPLVLANGSVMLVYRYNPPNGKPAGETLAVAIAQSWRGPYVLIADNITNVPVLPGRFRRAGNGTVWFTQNSGGYAGRKWRVNCAAPCPGTQSWSGAAACGLASMASDAELARLQSMPLNFSCDQAATGKSFLSQMHALPM